MHGGLTSTRYVVCKSVTLLGKCFYAPLHGYAQKQISQDRLGTPTKNNNTLSESFVRAAFVAHMSVPRTMNCLAARQGLSQMACSLHAIRDVEPSVYMVRYRVALRTKLRLKISRHIQVSFTRVCCHLSKWKFYTRCLAARSCREQLR
jgi:hypothetical protein